MSGEARGARYLAMANAAIGAWRSLFGTTPTKHAIVLVLAVAEHETPGGGPKGAHNWGGVKKRPLSPGEAALLAAHGVRAADGPSAVAAARALLSAGPDEILYRDSSPEGWHFAWFWRSDTEERAARRLLQTLVAARPKVRAILDGATPLELARAMYETRYYTGTSTDAETNVRTYAAALEGHVARIAAALPHWITTPWPAGPELGEAPPTLPALGGRARPPRAPSAAPILVLFGVVGLGLALARSR